MSVQALSWVLDYSESEHSARLVLISIANHAKKDGTGAWPSVATIAEESRLSEREVRNSLRDLESLKELSTELNAGPHGTNLYSLPKMQGAEFAGGRKMQRGGQNLPITPVQNAPEPSLTVQKQPSKPMASPEVKDFRFSECKEIAYKDFKTRYGTNPTWSAADYTQLTFLVARNKELTTTEFSRRWQNFLNSTEKFTASQGGSLKFFCSRFDSFIEGALLETKRNGGKLSGRELTEHNLRAAGFIG